MEKKGRWREAMEKRDDGERQECGGGRRREGRRARRERRRRARRRRARRRERGVPVWSTARKSGEVQLKSLFHRRPFSVGPTSLQLRPPRPCVSSLTSCIAFTSIDVQSTLNLGSIDAPSTLNRRSIDAQSTLNRRSIDQPHRRCSSRCSALNPSSQVDVLFPRGLKRWRAISQRRR